MKANASGVLEQRGFRDRESISCRAFVPAIISMERSGGLQSSVSLASMGSAFVFHLAYCARSKKFQVFSRSNAVVGNGTTKIVYSKSYRASRLWRLSARSHTVYIASVFSAQEGAKEIEASHRSVQVKH